MLAAVPELNESPLGSGVPVPTTTAPWVAPELNESGIATVKNRLYGLVMIGTSATVTGNGVRTANDPAATGASLGLNVPEVPTGGVPVSNAVPSPLSLRFNQDAFWSGI
jgi:hypothetical protein